MSNFFGVIAMVAFLLLGLGAFAVFRRSNYALWYRTHVLCTLIAFYGLYYHHQLGRVDVALPFALLMAIDYAARLVRVLLRIS